MGIVGACALAFVGSNIWEYTNDLAKASDKSEIYHKLVIVLRYTLQLLAALVYPTARLVLLGLAVSSLRSLPPSAFDTVDWIELVPHI